MVTGCSCGLVVQNMKVISKRTKGTAQDDTSGKMERYLPACWTNTGAKFSYH